MTSRHENDLSLAILQYLLANPEGMDSLMGIARFWIARQRIEASVSDVKETLTLLVERGLLKENRLFAEVATSECFYRLNESRMSEIRSLLSQRPDEPHP